MRLTKEIILQLFKNNFKLMAENTETDKKNFTLKLTFLFKKNYTGLPIIPNVDNNEINL